ncbi:MAG: hypothetical protein EPN71_14980 [Rhodanobacter sp.]|nr:MAG: hypothetical protein EPN71_14980 [Rhodanobacter sp.]
MNPVIAFAPPLDQTPTFPLMVLGGTLVTVEPPRTVKLAKSEPNIGVANAAPGPQQAPITANARIHLGPGRPATCALCAYLDTIFMVPLLKAQ